MLRCTRMELPSIFSLSTTALGILDHLDKSLKFLLQLSTKTKHVDPKVSLSIGYFASIQALLNQISAIVKSPLDGSQHRDVLESLGATLDCTSFTFVLLESKVAALGMASSDALNNLDTPVILFEASEFEKYLKCVSSVVNGLSLHLNILQIQSLQEQRNTLNSVEARSILEAIEDEVSLLLRTGDTKHMLTQQAKLSENSRALSIDHPFDAQHLSSRINDVSDRSDLRQELNSNQNGVGEREDPPSYEESTEISSSMKSEYREKSSGLHVNTSTSIRPSELHRQSKSIPSSLFLPRKTSLFPANLALFSKRLRTRTCSDLKGCLAVPTRQRCCTTSPRQVNIEVQANTMPPQKSNPNDFNILVLGAHDSGKTTWSRAIELFEEGPWPSSERRQYRTRIISNTVANVQVVLRAMESWDMPLQSEEDRMHVLAIASQPSEMVTMPSEVVRAINALRRDENFNYVLKHQNKYQLQDHSKYFFDSVDRISQPDYVPTDEDILRSSQRTTGITSSFYPSPDAHRPSSWRVFDVGGSRSERKKWIHVREAASLVIFTVDMGEFDQWLYEDETVNRMDESVNLFESIMGWRDLAESKIVLCFTKQQKHASKQKDRKEETEAGTTTRFRNIVSVKDLARIMVMVLPDLPTKDDWERIKVFVESGGKANWPYWSGPVDNRSFLFEQWATGVLPSST